MKENDEQVRLAKEALSQLGATDVKIVTYNSYLCELLLNRAVHYLKQFNDHGLMSDREAGDYWRRLK